MAPAAAQPQAMDRAAAAFAAGHVDEAAALCESILREDPRHFYALHLLGAIALQRARWEDALGFAARALEVRPQHPDVLANRGAALRRLGRYPEALADYDRVLAANPNAIDARHNRAVALAALGRHEEAIAEYVSALQAAPGFTEAFHNLGGSLAALNRHAEAVHAHSRALALDPSHVRARWHRSLSLLALGRFAEGFADYEARHAVGDARAAMRPAAATVWSGRESVAGRTVLLLAEQGFGDTLLFVRFARILHERGARVLLAAPRELAELLRTLPYIAGVIEPHEPLPACDFTCALASLPARLGASLENLTAQEPLLAAPQHAVEKWRARLAGMPHPRIGIAWSGGLGDAHDPRALRVEQWQALRQLATTFVSLQKRVSAHEALALDAEPAVRHFEHDIADFTDTAALIAGVDLVITVDTAVAHLAGAMGHPAWILLPFAADWRWLLGREDSPWYPGARLFRQPRPGDWESVIRAVAGELARHFAPGAPAAPRDSAKQHARALLASGRVAEAEDLARQHAAAADPDGEWLHLLGAARHLAGRHEDAIASLEEAAALSPRDAHVRNTLGASRMALGDLARAQEAFEAALALDPEDAEARFNRAVLLQRRGDERAALGELGALVSARPDHASARLEWALALLRAGRAAEADAALIPLVSRAPADARVFLAAGSARLALGDREGAARLAGRAGESASGNDALRERAADLLAAAGRAREALSHYSFAIARRPDDAALVAKLAAASNAAGDTARAIELWRGQLRRGQGARDAAQNLAVALYEGGARDEALDVLRRAIADGHDDGQMLDALAVYKASECQWAGLDEIVARLRVTEGPRPAPPASSLFFDGVTPADQLRWARRWCEAQWLHAPERPPRTPRGARLRVGFLSGDLHAHATAWLITPVMEAHDRERFEFVAYSHSVQDATDMRERAVRSFDRFTEIGHLDDAQAAARIRADGIDVLLDMGGHTKSGRLGVLAHRPAHLQGHFLGYPGTTGAPFVDFYVGDAQALPARLEAGFSERIARMPSCYQPNGRARAPATTTSRADHGLPADGVVFCSFNQPIKITSRVFDRWCELLRAVHGSVLWLLDVDERAKANLQREAGTRGIDPARLVFAPRMAIALHVARIRHADIALDPFPCGSHTTASDVIRAGVPLVTTRGDTFASRVASSVLAAAGCAEWVFDDPDRAFEATLALARSPRLRQAARQRAEAAIESPLFDAQGYARAFEELLLRLWREAPTTFAGVPSAGVQ